jgi:lysophospholipase L1-like esterase
MSHSARLCCVLSAFVSLIGICLAAEPAQSAAEIRKFDFGSQRTSPGWTAVTASDAYDPAKGYGFEDFGTQQNSDAAGDPLLSDSITSSAGACFSVKLPEGTYRVKVTLGDAAKPADTTIKAEARKLMIESAKTRTGEHQVREFSVNIRTPKLADGKQVAIAPQEAKLLQWDDKLTIEWLGPHASVAALEISPEPGAPVVWLLGDSTVTDQDYEPWNSWGQMLTRFFKPGIAVANHARSGASIRSSLSSRRVQKVLDGVKPGDFVCIQFGHNDMKDRRPTALEEYRANLVKLARDIQTKGGQTILITSMERKSGVQKLTLAGYPDAVRSVAKELNLPCIDLQNTSLVLYRALGEQLNSAFVDGTHHNPYGSYLLARCVTLGIRDQVPTLAKWLTPDAFPFDPSSLAAPASFSVPASSRIDPTKPEGN